MYAAHVSLSQDRLDRMAVVAGVGFKTLFRLEFEKRFFGAWDHTRKVRDRVAGDPHREGDGRVPLASAALDAVTIRYVRGVHGSLPNIPAVYDAVFDALDGGDIALPTTPAQALGAHLAAPETSAVPALDGSALTTADGDDPGFWEDDADPAELDRLAAALKAGTLPGFAAVKLL
jgi:hypothetical protein